MRGNCMPPFGVEREEQAHSAFQPCKRLQRAIVPTRLSPYGAEPEEFDGAALATSDSDTDSQDDRREGLGVPADKRVKALGWELLHAAKGAGFWGKAASAPPRPLKRNYNNTRRAASARYRRSKRCFEANGKDPVRIKRLLALKTCVCKPVVKCCYQQFNVKELSQFLEVYWSWPKWERQGLAPGWHHNMAEKWYAST